MTSTANTDYLLAMAYLAAGFIAAYPRLSAARYRSARKFSDWLDRLGSATRENP